MANPFPKPQSFRRLISGFFPSSDRRKGYDYENEWEHIVVPDQELPGSKEKETAGDSEFSECGDESCIPSTSSLHKIKYTILNKAEVLKLLEDEITRVSTVLSVSRSEAATLLHQFKWSVVKAEEEWLTCEEKVRKTVGLFEKPVVAAPATAEIACWICHENFPGKIMLGVSCGHQVCRSCWTGYISKAIRDGPECLALRCPGPSCDASVGLDLIELLSPGEDKKKFEDYLTRSFLTGTREAKWCPAQGCEYAVLLNNGGDCSTVTCQCSYKFCWNCSKEAHTPVDCDTAEKWLSEINTQSENWLLTYTKPCPTCGRPIQQYLGHKYLECTFRRFEICGIRFGKQSHVASDYWYRNCPCRGSLRFAGYHEEDECERYIAKISLRRYRHFYGGWIINESARANAMTDLKLFQEVHMEMICKIFGLNENELDFLVDAQLQITECYQLLKWTNVYGYYIPVDENSKLHLFEFMQAQAKDLVEQLHKQVNKFEFCLNEDVHLQHFMDFRGKLLMLTRAARNYLDKMVEALAAGLPEVVSIQSPTTVARGKGQPKPKRNDRGMQNDKSDLSWFLARFIDASSKSTSPNLKARPKD